MSTLDFSSLHNALTTLDEALKRTPSQDTLIRDGCIQRFEYSYELSIRMLRRTLEHISDHAEEIQQASFRDLIRIAAEKGLISNPIRWFEFRNKRNITSHTYNEDKAEEVFAIIPEFAQAAHELLQHMETKH